MNGIMFLGILILSVFGENCRDLVPENRVCPSPCWLENEGCVDECSTGYFRDEESTSCIFNCSNVIYNSSDEDPCPLPCFIEWGTCVNECNEGFGLRNPVAAICDVTNCSAVSQRDGTCPPACFPECVSECSLDNYYVVDEGKCFLRNCASLDPELFEMSCPKPCLLKGFSCVTVSECEGESIIPNDDLTECVEKTCSQFSPNTATSWASCNHPTDYLCYVQNETCVKDCDEGYEVVRNSHCMPRHACDELDAASEDCQWTCFVQDNETCVYECDSGFVPDEDMHYCIVGGSGPVNPPRPRNPKKENDPIVLIAISAVVGVVVGVLIIVVVVCVMRRRGSRQQYTEVKENDDIGRVLEGRGRVLEAYE